MIVALWGRDQLAEDTGVEDSGGWGGITLAHNVALARRGRRGDRRGGSSRRDRSPRRARRPSGAATPGAFADPDGHAWEVAHNPHWTLAEDGSVSL